MYDKKQIISMKSNVRQRRLMPAIFNGRVSNHTEFMYPKNCMFNKNQKNLCDQKHVPVLMKPHNCLKILLISYHKSDC